MNDKMQQEDLREEGLGALKEAALGPDCEDLWPALFRGEDSARVALNQRYRATTEQKDVLWNYLDAYRQGYEETWGEIAQHLEKLRRKLDKLEETMWAETQDLDLSEVKATIEAHWDALDLNFESVTMRDVDYGF